MAKQRKRRRPAAGPPPVRNPRADEAASRADRPAKKTVRPAIRPPSFRGVVIRAGVVCLLFLPYLVYLADEPFDRAIFITAIAFMVMIPLGLAIDRIRYRMQTRKTSPPSPEGEE